MINDRKENAAYAAYLNFTATYFVEGMQAHAYRE